ncbi:hypothetical protein [Roseiconus lacunae]|uniref:hypothetical protein n=1 Tax=Roseiconus lacunae TaxID=2605694 RepID=UPI0011F1DA8C|nr:hypothetical protein [Roseiconus lacunae]
MSDTVAGENEFQPQSPNKFIYVFSALVLGCVAFYFLFMTVNTAGLSISHGSATVVGKRFQEGGTSSFTQPVGNQRIVRVQETPSAYVVKLEISEQQTEFPIDKELYDRVSAGDRLAVEYQTTRLTGAIQVTSVSRPAAN